MVLDYCYDNLIYTLFLDPKRDFLKYALQLYLELLTIQMLFCSPLILFLLVWIIVLIDILE